MITFMTIVLVMIVKAVKCMSINLVIFLKVRFQVKKNQFDNWLRTLFYSKNIYFPVHKFNICHVIAS